MTDSGGHGCIMCAVFKKVVQTDPGTIVLWYDCVTLYILVFAAPRYAIVRNFLFLPWDSISEEEAASGSTSAGAGFLAKHVPNASQMSTPQNKYSWLTREPTRFLYCHQKHETKSECVANTCIVR